MSNTVDVILVGHEDQENLGLRSIMSTLNANGVGALLVPYSPGNPSPIIAAAREHHPLLIGFSIIFQYALEDFQSITAALRSSGATCHFAVGGHFPSLRPKETLELLPDVDSVVRFEGELTALHLVQSLRAGSDWTAVPGIAFRRHGEFLTNPVRPLVPDLDDLPDVYRDRVGLLTRGVSTMSMLASRGCLYNCAFCSIRQFYGAVPGPLRRTRSPQRVVSEMRSLHARSGVEFFIFQDDDFASRSPAQRAWLDAFLDELQRSGIAGKVFWKISCRVDDVDAGRMARCRDHGLLFVYLGVESGSPAGLRTLNKRVTVEQNVAAIEVLKRCGITFDMGFMLFEPDSTFPTVRENIAFLRAMTSDGSCAANFCKMLPYAGTPIEERLRTAGRLKGTTARPDYSFLDPGLDWMAMFAAMTLRMRNYDRLGLVERLRRARADAVFARVLRRESFADAYEAAVIELTARTNRALFDTLESMVATFEGKNDEEIATLWPYLQPLAQREAEVEAAIQQELDTVLARYSPEILQGDAEEFYRRFPPQQSLSATA